MNIYQPPDSPIGPDRSSNAYPMGPDPAEARELRRLSEWEFVGPPQMWSWQDPGLWPVQRDLGPEQFAGYDEWASAYELFGGDL